MRDEMILTALKYFRKMKEVVPKEYADVDPLFGKIKEKELEFLDNLIKEYER